MFHLKILQSKAVCSTKTSTTDQSGIANSEPRNISVEKTDKIV